MGKVQVQRSAGGVTYREVDGQMMVVLIATKQGKVWGLPKGQIEESEEPLAAALREVREETGLTSECVADLGRIEYWYRDSESTVLFHKFVHFFLFRYTGGDVGQHGWEVDEARWFSIDDAVDSISYDDEREVLLRGRERWESLSHEDH
jgi:8-oxo-dGTP pyrophosphatase MutT (NUDIX family)